MANKTIGQLEDSNYLDGNDFIALYNAEPSVDNITYKARVNDVLGLKTIIVNGKTGSTITLNADDRIKFVIEHFFQIDRLAVV